MKEMKTRIVIKYSLFYLEHCVRLQKKVWYGWKTISWCFAEVMYNVYGTDKQDIESWLWWNYRIHTKANKVHEQLKEVFKGETVLKKRI